MDPIWQYTIEGLQQRTYGGGTLAVEQTLAVNSYFTRTLVTYPSDSLTIYGFMNLPQGEGPFPVVIALHGYIDPAIYTTLDYTTGYADTLARAGYLVLHPNLRGYPPSDDGDNLFRVGMAVDVLNLIAIVRQQGGKPGPLALANPQAIALWGHSMGGGISTRVMTVDAGLRAVVLYAPMTGDERRNYEAIQRWSGGTRGLEELSVPEAELLRISPVHYFDLVTAPVSIHHGRADELIPLSWSLETCEQLRGLEKAVECLDYADQPHTFVGDGAVVLMQNVIEFLNQYMK